MQNLRTQLLLSHFLLIVLMGFVLGGAVVAFFRLGRSIDHILRDNYQSVQAAQTMKESLEQQNHAAALHLAGQTEAARAEYARAVPVFEAAYQVEKNNVTEVGEQAATDDVGHLWAAYQKAMGGFLVSPSRETYFATLEPAFARLKQRVQAVQDVNQNAILRADQAARQEAERDTLVGIAVTVSALLIGLGTAARTVNAALLPLVGVARQTEAIGAGQFNQRLDVRRDDEIGVLARAFNAMSEKLEQARQVEAARLRLAERMSDAALENLYDPVIVTNAQARIVHLNRAAEGLFGAAAQLRGLPVRQVVRENRLAGAIEQAVQKEHVSAEEGDAAMIAFGSAGDSTVPRTYRMRVTPMHGENDAHIGAVAVLEDVTYLQEIDRLKTEFVGIASHELRTPVTSLLLSVQLLEEGAAGALSAEQAEIVRAQKADLQRLHAMMRDLLDLTRLEAGATPPRLEVVEPGELLYAAQATVRGVAGVKRIRLNVEAANDTPPVRADRAQIGRVLTNLLTNAVRHTPDFGKITLRAEGDATRSFVRFVVEDTGSGIPPEYLAHIFERFVQVPGATSGGAGLGLSLAQTIVQAHGGEIFAHSTPGEGSIFTFTLPTATVAKSVNDMG